MNKIILNYILKNFLKTFLITIAVVYSFGIILNLFEEIEFFKNLNVSILTPIILTSVNVPSIIIKILPFVIFVSSAIFMLKIRNNNDLLNLKVFGFSNLKIFFILAFTSFLLGWIVLIAINPVTASLSKYYEKTKSNYSRDIDHLVNFTKNGLWIKENTKKFQRVISANKPEGDFLLDVEIFHLDQNMNLLEKISSHKVNIKNNEWILEDASIFRPTNGVFKEEKHYEYRINSIYNYNKLNSLFKNFNTLSFLTLITDFEKLIESGYSKFFLTQSLHIMLSLPFFLFLMTALSAIFTLNSLKKTDNLKLITVGLFTCVLTFYFKDLSLALGKTDRIPIILAIWSPVIALSFLTFIGVLQINEK